ncbi:hypothetical protein EON77_04580, partial [bacterium]
MHDDLIVAGCGGMLRDMPTEPSRPSPPASLVAGIALFGGGAVLFASKGVFAKALYRSGMDFQT